MKLIPPLALFGYFCYLLPPVQASTIYTYTGSDFQQVLTGGDNRAWGSTSQHILGWFKIPWALPANWSGPIYGLYLYPNQIQDWSISDGVNTIDASTPGIRGPNSATLFLSVDTDSDRNIVRWDFGGAVWSDHDNAIVLSTSNDVLLGVWDSTTALDAAYNSRSALNHDIPGTWSVNSESSVPEPNASMCLISGLCILRVLWRRRAANKNS